MKFLCQGVQKLWPEQTETQTHRQTHRQMDRHGQKHYLPAYMGGNNAPSWHWCQCIPLTSVSVTCADQKGSVHFKASPI